MLNDHHSIIKKLIYTHINFRIRLIMSGLKQTEKVTEIGDYEYANMIFDIGCPITKELENPELLNIDRIGEYTFYNSNLSQFTIPNGVKYIGPYSFENTPLTHISIPESVISIGNGAFKYN